MEYLIKLNTPTARWTPEMAAIFGANNQGVPVGAPDKENAIAAFNCALLPGQRFNPFYLRVIEIKRTEAQQAAIEQDFLDACRDNFLKG